MHQNLILNVDSYKTSHYLQYPSGTQYISSYIAARGGAYAQGIFFGLQAFLLEYLTKPITKENIDEAQIFLKSHGMPFYKAGWEHILDKHGGYLPLAIEAVPEGMLLDINNVLLQVVNTDPECFWLGTYIETALLRAIWYPSTVATISHACKQIIKRYLAMTAENLTTLDWQLHDFGARGASSYETAALGAMAHLLNFKGTDTIAGILAAKRYYDEEMAGYSIAAAEHSTIIAWGRESESKAYEHIINVCGGEGRSVAVVSDSYDLWQAIDKIWGDELKEKVQNHGGTLVIRPDSGNPVEVVSNTINMLMNRFGFAVNAKGYKVLPTYIRIIQGDGVSIKKIEEILQVMCQQKLSAENVAFGMGANLLQRVDRDTMFFAMKASAINISGKWHNINKAPITDLNKKSMPGRLALIKEGGQFSTIDVNQLQGRENLLQKVFQNGEILIKEDFQQIRDRITNQK